MLDAEWLEKKRTRDQKTSARVKSGIHTDRSQQTSEGALPSQGAMLPHRQAMEAPRLTLIGNTTCSRQYTALQITGRSLTPCTYFPTDRLPAWAESAV